MISSAQYGSIGIFSDSHLPYHHPDTFHFYEEVKSVYRPEVWVHIGDDTDGHAWSYHESETSLDGPDKEFEAAKQAYHAGFLPIVGSKKCYLIGSNHGWLHLRKAKSAGIPTQLVRDAYRMAMGLPSNWLTVPYIELTLNDGRPVQFHHGIAKNLWVAVKERGISLVTGHYHTELCAHQEYIYSIGKMLFSLQVGCTIYDKSAAFNYNKTHKQKPKLGCGVIYDGQPIPIHMALDKHGRWVGKL